MSTRSFNFGIRKGLLRIRLRILAQVGILASILIGPTLASAKQTSTPVGGQAGQTLSTVSGSVEDPSGGAVAGVRISVLDASGAVRETATTGTTGDFSLTGLTPGKYTLKAESDAFQTATADVEVVAGLPTAPVRFSLKLREVSGQVNVVAGAESLTVPAASSAEAQLETVPGDVSEVTADQYRSGAVLGVDDALSLTPGVFAGPNEGTEEVTLSIRGSDMNVPFGVRGVSLLQDGIPVSFADGYSNIEQVDPFNDDYIEVYRGADGLEFGAATLGGAVNFVSPTGRSQPGWDIRSEFGSDDYFRDQVRYGTVTDNGRLDLFVALSGVYTDGFRQNNKESTYRFSSNVGYRFTPKSEGRLFFDIMSMDQQRPGAITLAQLQSGPTVAATGAVITDAGIDFKPYVRIAYKHTLLLGTADQLSFYVQFLTIPFFNNPTPYARYSGAEQDFSLGLRHEINHTLLEHKSRFVWGADWSHYWDLENTNGPVYFGTYEAISSTGILQQTKDQNDLTQAFAQDSVNLTTTLTLVGGAQFEYAQRSLVSTTPTPADYYGTPLFLPVTTSKNYTGFNPKVGLIWAPRPKAQIFANVSRSFEPPDEYEYSPGISSPGSSLPNLDAQTGTTLEAGTRGGGPDFGWDFATYYSWIDKEILSIESPPNSGSYVTFNADHTLHSGVEAGVHGKLPFVLAGGSFNGNLAYTWSDFRFSNDPVYGDNRLPVVPPQFGRLDLTWRHPSGFYAGPNFMFASDLSIDLANTFKAPGYGVVGATVGWSREGKYRVFLDCRNLANKYYAASTLFQENVGGKDYPAFNPGLLRSIFGGVEINVK